MRAADGLHTEWVEDEAVVLDVEGGQLHYLNPPAALVFAAIQEHGYDEGIAELKQRFGADTAFEQELPGVIESMVKKGLLVDD